MKSYFMFIETHKDQTPHTLQLISTTISIRCHTDPTEVLIVITVAFYSQNPAISLWQMDYIDTALFLYWRTLKMTGINNYYIIQI